jgi:hypothetical protein
MRPFLKAPEGVAIKYRDGSHAEGIPLAWSHFNDAEQLHCWEAIDPHPERPVEALTVEVLPPHTTITLVR